MRAVRHWPYRSGMAEGPSDAGSPKPPPEVLRELTPTGRRRFVFAGWEETPGGYRSLIELSTEAADDPAGLARAFLEALRTSDLLGDEHGEPTGWRLVRGTHGVDYVRDPEGRDTPPAELPRGRGRAAGAPAAQRARRARRGRSRDPRAGDRRHPRAPRAARRRTTPAPPPDAGREGAPRAPAARRHRGACRRRSGPTRRRCASVTCCSCRARPASIPQPERAATGGFPAEARQAFANVAQVLEASGSSLGAGRQADRLHGERRGLPGAQRAVRRVLPDRRRPTRSVPIVSLPRGLLISIEAIAAA